MTRVKVTNPTCISQKFSFVCLSVGLFVNLSVRNLNFGMAFRQRMVGMSFTNEEIRIAPNL